MNSSVLRNDNGFKGLLPPTSLGFDEPGEPRLEGVTITAYAKPIEIAVSSNPFSLINFRYGVDYGPGTANPNMWINAGNATSDGSNEIVITATKVLASFIRTGKDLASPFLPASEERRFEALADTLEAASLALEIGEIDRSTFESLLKTSLAFALDQMGGVALGVLASAFGAYVGANTGNPVIGVAATGVGFLFGIAAEKLISDAGIADAIAGALVDGLFAGADALGNVLIYIEGQFREGNNPFGPDRFSLDDVISFEFESDGSFGNFDGNPNNGSEYGLNLGSSTDSLAGYVFTNPSYVNGGWDSYTGNWSPPTFDGGGMHGFTADTVLI